MSGFANLFLLLSKVSFSLYETDFNFKYTVDIAVDIDKPLYFTNRFNEAMNFSSINTGVAKDFWLSSSFEVKVGNKLCAVQITDSLNNQGNDSMMVYQRDFFDSILSSNCTKIKSCKNYFDECSTLEQNKLVSKIDQSTKRKQDFFILNKALLKTDDSARNEPLVVRFVSEAYVNLSHIKISSSLYYLIITATGVHCAVLLFNVIFLLRKRKNLRALITKVKTQ